MYWLASIILRATAPGSSSIQPAYGAAKVWATFEVAETLLTHGVQFGPSVTRGYVQQEIPQEVASMASPTCSAGNTATYTPISASAYQAS
jgi:hypothetical protein